MPRRLLLSVLWMGVVVLSGCDSNTPSSSPERLERTYTFAEEKAGWSALFVDYPTSADTTADGMGLTFGRRPLPDEVDGEGYGLFLSGRNTSDDLFMGLRRRLTELSPNTTYELTVDITLASAAPTGCVGIGGPPGEAVWVKAGGAGVRPERIVDDTGWYRLSIDKGNQKQGGEQARVLGTIANGVETCSDTPFRLITRTMDESLSITTSEEGTLWLMVGTDSGFEGVTRLYYDTIRVTLEP